MTDNTSKPIAPSGFRPRIAPGDGPGGFDKAEYATPESSGVTSGFYVTDRGLPWHVTLSRRLDTPELMVGADRKLTSREALDLAGLNFKTLLVPLMVQLPSGEVVEAPGKFATVREDTGLVLGVGMSAGFKVYDNDTAFAFADAIVGEYAANWETAAALAGGRQVFLSMELPNHIAIEGDPSEYRLYLLLSNGHDGKHMLRASVTIERGVCRNTVNIGHARARASWAIKHTSSMAGRVAEARTALGLSFAYAEAFSESASQMLSTTLAERQVDALLRQAFPLTEAVEERIEAEPEKAEAILATTTFGKVRDIYYESPSVAPIRGTAYGVFNAVTEWADHFKDYRPKGGVMTAEDIRLDNLVNGGPALDAKQRAWDLLVKASDPKNKAKVKA